MLWWFNISILVFIFYCSFKFSYGWHSAIYMHFHWIHCRLSLTPYSLRHAVNILTLICMILTVMQFFFEAKHRVHQTLWHTDANVPVAASPQPHPTKACAPVKLAGPVWWATKFAQLGDRASLKVLAKRSCRYRARLILFT